MLKVEGYTLKEKIYESTHSVIYKAFRNADNFPVAIKILSREYPSPGEIACFNLEYKISSELKSNSIIEIYSLEKCSNSLAIVMEYFEGRPLSQILSARKIGLEEFLKIAIQLTEVIGEVHSKKVIHKDINPSNVLWNQDTEKIKLIDFGISNLLFHETEEAVSLNQPEGSLPYISPEQTGRMNRKIDYRTDYYSLGITFYELLTGQKPFQSEDLMEMVHFHIAKSPVPPYELSPGVPRVLSDIVLKLMSKDPENRYQSSFGIRHDLEKCLRNFGLVYFDIGQKDIPEKLEIPQKLFGREEEVRVLIRDFHAMSATSESQLTLITGYSGVGKSSLVSELYKWIFKKRGYFISGKCEQLSRNIPYSPFIQAINGLIKQILKEDHQSLAAWREKILNGVGTSGQVIINLIPMLEIILGRQPEIPELPPQKAQNRFNRVFQSFVKALATKEHPFVVHIDDLQWADTSSLKMLELFMTNADIKHILFICTYRDNEVGSTHPLSMIMDEIKKTGKMVNYITLNPLSFHNVNLLLCETLRCDIKKTEALAQLCLRKTDGNPFFLNQFLRSLYEEKLLEFDIYDGEWKWDIGRIEEKRITNNVVDLMTSKIRKLSQKAQDILKIAACSGNTFDLEMISIINEKSEVEASDGLFEALQEGLILPSANSAKTFCNNHHISNISYKFLHDRLQQAAYSMIDESLRMQVHLKIGRFLLKNSVGGFLEDRIFDIVNHLNRGISLIDLQEEKIKLSELNLNAGIKAKNSAAFEVSFKYLKHGIELLNGNYWNSQYELSLNLYTEISEVACLCGNYEEMDRFTEIVLQHANKELTEKIKVYEIRIRAFVAQNKRLEAVKLGLWVLKLLGIHIPVNPTKLNILFGLLKTRLILANKKTINLMNQPEMKEQSQLWAIRILLDIGSAAYFTNSSVFVLMGYKAVELSVKYGNNSLSNNAYSIYAMTYAALQDIRTCLKWRQVSLSLFEKYNTLETRAKDIAIYYYLLAHYDTGMEDILKSLHEGYLTGLETGDTEYAALCIHMCVTLKYYKGFELTGLEKEAVSVTTTINKLKQESLLERIKTTHQGILNLIQPSNNHTKLSGEALNEDTMIPYCKSRNNKTGLCYLYSTKMILSMIFCDYDSGIEAAKKTKENLEGVVSTIVIPIYYFYESLIYLAVYEKCSKFEKMRILRIVSRNQRNLKKRAYFAPMNHLHKYYLVKAELSRVLGKHILAEDYYEKAINTAAKNEYVNEEAIASERAAIYYLSRGSERIAFTYLTHAKFCYERWGAFAKVNNLYETYPVLYDIKSNNRKKRIEALSKASITNHVGIQSIQHLDLTSVIKASQAISGEIVYKKLIEKLMKVIVENAGAQKIVIVKVREEKLLIEAMYRVGDLEAVIFDDYLSNQKYDISKIAPVSIMNYIARTKETLVLDDVSCKTQFKNDTYVKENHPKSILCMPLIYQGNVLRILYIENNLATEAFTEERVKILNMLSAQMVISIENAKVYEHLEELVNERTKRLEVMATHDNLTGLPNRKYFQDKLVHTLSAANIKNTKLAVLFIDLDGFKKINDTLGHDIGDMVLKNVSERMMKCVGEGDTIARLGGDEFTIILDNINGEQHIHSICQRIVNEIGKPILFGKTQVIVTPSVGISYYPNHGDDAYELIKKADYAMYIAKKTGKNNFIFYSEEYNKKAQLPQ